MTKQYIIKVPDAQLSHPLLIGRGVLSGESNGSAQPALDPQVHTNRFGVIPKGTRGKWHLIVYM